MQGAPEIILVGVKREGLSYFNDLDALAKHPGPYKITQVDVQYNDKHILGTVFHYKAADGHHHVGHDITKFKPFGELFGHVHSKSFHVDEDDELLEISGHAGLRINELTFKTYKGKHETFGHKDGVHFAFQFPGHTFGAVAGGFGEHLDFLEIRTHHLPEHKHHLKVLIVVN